MSGQHSRLTKETQHLLFIKLKKEEETKRLRYICFDWFSFYILRELDYWIIIFYLNALIKTEKKKLIKSVSFFSCLFIMWAYQIEREFYLLSALDDNQGFCWLNFSSFFFLSLCIMVNFLSYSFR